MGANHKSAPMDLREKLYIPNDKLIELLPRIKKSYNFTELLVLSTCNRFELLGVAHEGDIESQMFKAYIDLQGANENLASFGNHDLKDNLYLYKSGQAVQHVYRVASSLDSLVLGETQITGQFKEAVQLASRVKTLGPMLNRLSQEALATAKKVRTQTVIGQKHVSISHAALDLAKKVFGDLGEHKYLIIGAGEMARIAAKNIMQYSPKDLMIANRTIGNAQALQEELGFGHAYAMEEIPNLMQHVDIVLSSTSSSGTVIDAAMVKRAQSGRRGRPLILLDIALPRDIDPKAGELEDVYLFDIDDLQQVVGANYEERRKAAEEAQILIDKSVLGFEDWLANFDIKPVLADCRKYFDELINREFDKTIGKQMYEQLSAEQTAGLQSMLQAIAGKITADISRGVKQPPEGIFKEQLADALKVLFPKQKK
jgi:glutamyl-tRNA reductase